MNMQPGQPSMMMNPIYNAPPGSIPMHPMYSQTPGYGAPPQGVWMQAPAPIPGCPAGLEYLSMVDQLLVHQQVELFEAFTGIETNNKYAVKNVMGQQVYFAAEDSDFCSRQCCGSLRPFQMQIFDNMQREVVHLSRPYNCQACCFPCCLQKLEVSAPRGTPVGFVIQEWSLFSQSFRIEDAQHQTVLRIEGPCITSSLCCGDVEFLVLDKSGKSQVGKITKQWSGYVKEAFTDADNFGIQFPMDLDVTVKATLLGALFLIDFMFYETSPSQPDHHHH